MSIESSELWRAVLAEYPTGVALVTANLADGEPAGMIVGSFTAISQDPPLIGYFGDDSSSTFRSIEVAGRFAVSVLSDTDDALLRSFIRKDEGRFEQSGLTRTANGLLRVEDAVAWFEARTESVQRIGDHQLVVGHVDEFGVGSPDAGSPLLYRRGGFGAFAIPADALDARLVGERVATAQIAAEVLLPLVDRVGGDIAITASVGESVVVVGLVSRAPAERARSNLQPTSGPMRAIGIWLPFAAPVEPLFAAWAPERTRSFWIERARHLVGSVDRRGVEAQLAAIRERGYSVSVDAELTSRFFNVIADPKAQRESYAQMWSEYASRTIESVSSDLPLSDIAAVQVPVFNADGQVALVLTVSDVGPFPDPAALDAFADDLLAAANRVAEAIREISR